MITWKEHPELTVNASQISWQLDSDSSDMLPVMQTDLMLSRRKRYLSLMRNTMNYTTRVQYGKHKLHSDNLYQIFTYVKNKEYELKDQPHEVAGYAFVCPDREENPAGPEI